MINTTVSQRFSRIPCICSSVVVSVDMLLSLTVKHSSTEHKQTTIFFFSGATAAYTSSEKQTILYKQWGEGTCCVCFLDGEEGGPPPSRLPHRRTAFFRCAARRGRDVNESGVERWCREGMREGRSERSKAIAGVRGEGQAAAPHTGARHERERRVPCSTRTQKFWAGWYWAEFTHGPGGGVDRALIPTG